jgi:hypothetical protein
VYEKVAAAPKIAIATNNRQYSLIYVLYFRAYAKRARILLNAMLNTGQIEPLIKANSAPKNKYLLCFDPNLNNFPKTFSCYSLGGSFYFFYSSFSVCLAEVLPPSSVTELNFSSLF